MQLNHLADIRDGYRDINSGDFNYDAKGNIAPILRYNPQTRQMDLPLNYGTGEVGLQTVLSYQRERSGFYKDKIKEAGKQGANAVINAINKRDVQEITNDDIDRKPSFENLMQQMNAVDPEDPNAYQKIDEINKKIDALEKSQRLGGAG